MFIINTLIPKFTNTETQIVYRPLGMVYDSHLNFKGLFIMGLKVKMLLLRILQNLCNLANTSITKIY